MTAGRRLVGQIALQETFRKAQQSRAGLSRLFGHGQSVAQRRIGRLTKFGCLRGRDPHGSHRYALLGIGNLLSQLMLIPAGSFGRRKLDRRLAS